MIDDSTIDVCIVEDDAAMRVAMSRVLEAAGFHPWSYPSGEALLASAHVMRPTCFIIDINLPGMSGFQLAAQLVASRRAAPFIFITAHDEVTNRRRALAAGAAAFLPKPFLGRTLIEAVRATGHPGGATTKNA